MSVTNNPLYREFLNTLAVIPDSAQRVHKARELVTSGPADKLAQRQEICLAALQFLGEINQKALNDVHEIQSWMKEAVSSSPSHAHEVSRTVTTVAGSTVGHETSEDETTPAFRQFLSIFEDVTKTPEDRAAEARKLVTSGPADQLEHRQRVCLAALQNVQDSYQETINEVHQLRLWVEIEGTQIPSHAQEVSQTINTTANPAMASQSPIETSSGRLPRTSEVTGVEVFKFLHAEQDRIHLEAAGDSQKELDIWLEQARKVLPPGTDLSGLTVEGIIEKLNDAYRQALSRQTLRSMGLRRAQSIANPPSLPSLENATTSTLKELSALHEYIHQEAAGDSDTELAMWKEQAEKLLPGKDLTQFRTSEELFRQIQNAYAHTISRNTMIRQGLRRVESLYRPELTRPESPLTPPDLKRAGSLPPIDEKQDEAI